jgi:predicted TPR repeat methyltransferase
MSMPIDRPPGGGSSGDPIADRRLHHALGYRAAGDDRAAADLAAQAVELVPNWAEAWLVLGELRQALGETEEAIQAFRRALESDPADRVGAGVRLARLGAAPPDAAIAPHHVAALFDDYAARFDAELVDRLGYCAPALLEGAVAATTARRFARMIDLGCGTGLAALAFRDRCASMDGIDLSAAMLAEAAKRGIYRRLQQGEIVQRLGQEEEGSADLVVAADVLVYIGDLAPLFAAVARALTPGGLFAFTVQAGAGSDPFALGPDLRYAHSRHGLEGWAASAGLAVRSITSASTRRDAGTPVPGFIVVLEKFWAIA